MQKDMTQKAFETIADVDGPAEALDKDAQEAEAANGLRHAASLSMTKVADGLIDPKLVLSWLLTSLGAPAVYAGALVPLREAGALLPQIFLAGYVRGMARRKWAWVVGSAGQGACAGLIVVAALVLEGAAAGLAICAALAVLALLLCLLQGYSGQDGGPGTARGRYRSGGVGLLGWRAAVCGAADVWHPARTGRCDCGHRVGSCALGRCGTAFCNA